MLRFLRISVVLLACALALRAAPAAADPTTDKNDAIEALLGWALVCQNVYNDMAEALETPDAYVFMTEDILGYHAVAVKKQQIDAFVGYLQVQNLLHPETLDEAITKAARVVGLDPWLVKVILEDRKAVLATGGAAVVHEKLQKLSEKDRAQIEDYMNQLAEEAEGYVKEAQQIGGIASWPPKGAAGNIFSPVEVGGVTVDYCLSWATDCGQPVADQFCKSNGFTKATSFDWTYMHPTRTLGSGETCDADYCGGFTKVVCE